MKMFRTILSVGFLVVSMSGAAQSQWLEDFDSYTSGFPLTSQSSWVIFPGAVRDVTVTNAEGFTPSQSVLIQSQGRVIYDFSNTPPGGQPTSGRWFVTAMTFLPTTSSVSNGWIKVLNDFPSNTPNYSVKLTWDENLKMLTDTASKNRAAVPLDQWVPLVICIDLDLDVYHIYYNGKALTRNASWTNAFPPAGLQQISAVELHAFSGFDSMYFDNVRLERAFGPCLVLSTSPNPVVGGAPMQLKCFGPTLSGGEPGALYSWTVNGAPFVQQILPFKYSNEGAWIFNTNAPSGLSGLEVGLRAAVFPAVGKAGLSNESVVIFQ